MENFLVCAVLKNYMPEICQNNHKITKELRVGLLSSF